MLESHGDFGEPVENLVHEEIGRRGRKGWAETLPRLCFSSNLTSG